VQLNAHSVTETVRGIVAGSGLNLDAALDARHAIKGLFEHIGLEFALARKLDVTEFGTTGTTDTGRLPEVLHALWRRLDDFDWLGAAERTATVFEDLNLDYLTWQHVRDEQDSSLVSGNEDATVRDLLDGRFDFAA
jgi:hypothetical protein